MMVAVDIAPRILAPVRGQMPGRDARISPKGRARNAFSVSVTSASLRAKIRSRSSASSGH
jgi:hypothetical protein